MVKKTSKARRNELEQPPTPDEVDAYEPSKTSTFSFADLADDGGPADDDEEDFGGLMSVIKASSNKSKGKKKSQPQVQAELTGKEAQEVTADDWLIDDPKPKKGKKSSKMAAVEEDLSAKAPTEATADDWMEEQTKPKKGKKGKKKETTVIHEEEEPDAAVTADTNGHAAAVGDLKLEEGAKNDAKVPIASKLDHGAPINEDTNAPRMLTKSEKEKAKKERDKARKKAQAAAKKATGAKLDDDVPQEEPSAQPEHAKAEEENQGEEEAEAEGTEGGDKKKKKKKKGAAKKEEDVTPSSTPKGGKQNAKISALRALVEQQQKARAEQLAKEEEERRRIEEEERRREEEERQREEAKLRKKEREKSKREELRKAGKLLTPKQKAEERARQQRLEALKASGVVIEGLQAASDQKKPVYGKKRINKKAQKDEGNEAEPSARDVAPESAQVEKADGDEGTIQDSRKAESEVKDSWDAPSEDEGVKDTWDASSASEEEDPQIGVVSADRVDQTNGRVASPRLPGHDIHAPSTPASHIKPTGDNVTESESGSDTDEDSSEDDESSEVDSEEEKLTATQRQLLKRKEEAAARRAKQHEEALAARSKDNLRSPICCILGHVDTGKTKLLDKIRQTNVQEGEAGGITQQIGATYFPIENIRAKTSVLKNDTTNYNLPGLLVIDTPGHESFTNLRSRGSSLCNIAILVVDIMHGLEPQTLESIRLLKDRKTPFVVALNKIDRLYGWEPTPDGGFQDSLAKQKPSVQRLFEDGLNKAKLAFAEQGLNAVAYYENNNFSRNVSLVPTSAISGEGIPDLLMLLCKLTTERMSDRLMYLSELECTVLEVKVVEGLGTTIDVVLSNGVLHVGDRIVLCGLTGAIATNIRQLLTPQPLKELRVKGQYVHHQSIKAAMGIKIGAPDLENAIAGSRLLVVGKDDDEDDLKDEVMADLAKLLNSIDRSKNGVCVQSSTLGSLEALLSFLKDSKIPVSGVNIGPVYKKDVMRAATMLERAKEYAVMLCFDVVVDKEAEKLAEEMGVTIFSAKIIYHLFDSFTAYMAKIQEAKRADAAPKAVWPCRLRTIAVFAKRDPIILGCEILEGSLRVGTPICVVKVTDLPDGTKKKETVSLGKVTSLEINHRPMQTVKQSQSGAGVAVKIEHASYESAKMFGRHFDDKDELLSMISRTSIDVLKSEFRDQVDRDDWVLIKKLKIALNIP